MNKPIKIYAEVLEPEALTQFYEAMSLDCNVQGALMPDAHTGYTLPIGAVIKSEGKIFPSYVGYDIGCGMSECLLNIKALDISIQQLEQIKEEILKRVPIGFSRHKKNQPLSRSLRDMPMTDFAKQVLEEAGPSQIGTLGGGKDYCFQAQR